MRASRSGFALLVALTLTSATARAQTGDAARAEASFRQGIEAMQATHYADAIVAFQESFRIRAVPTVLYNLALAYRALGHNLEAIATFQQYLSDAGTEVEPARVAAIRATLVTLRETCGLIPLDVRPPGATITVDGRPPLFSPNGRVLLVDPGERVVHVEAPGHVAQSRMVRVAARQRVPLAVALEPAPEPPPPVVISTAPPAPSCVPGVQLACACTDGTIGMQRCNARGTAMDVCACEAMPVPITRERQWYGWQILIVEGAASAIGVLAFTGVEAFGFAGGGISFLGPAIVHWAHRRVGVGFGSLGVRLAIPGVGALIGLGANNRDSTGIIVGASLGYLAAIVLDVTVFAWTSADVRRTTPRNTLRLGANVVPTAGGAMFSVGGAF